MGAAASYNLAHRGLRVLNIERFGVNHAWGSSHGRTRIIRLAYYEDPRYVPLLRRAYQAWREIESKSGKSLLRETGGLMIGRSDGKLVPGVVKSAKAHGLPYETMSGPEASARFEAFKLSEDLTVVHDPGAGVLSAEGSVRALVGLASEAGCEFRFSEEVSSWEASGEEIRVRTSLGIHTAQRVVFGAGGWNGSLLQGLVPLRCERQVPFWFPSKGENRFSASKMPVFMAEEEEGTYYYGIPDFGHGVKVARHHGGEVGDPDKTRRDVTDDDAAPVASFVGRRLNSLGTVPADAATCLYSNTPDLNFVVGSHPSEPRVIVLGGFSGHGFKFASVIGEVVADLATGGNPAYDISFLQPGRFGAQTASG